MHHLQRTKKNYWLKKQALALSLLIAALPACTQELNLPNHDDKSYYIGIAVMYNSARFQLSHHPHFLQNDSVLSVSPENAGGFGLAGMNNFVISPRFSVRVGMQFMLSSKNLTYNLKYPDASKEEQPVMTKKVESISFGVPLHIKLRSDRINNFRVYMFGGGAVGYDLASNAKAQKAEDLVKLRKYDMTVEGGIGFNFYFPVFILSPEIKISHGLINAHSRDEGLKFSSAIDKLNSRMVVFSLIFEG
ncbi:MAG: outer membrane beta-barrel protein [Flavitalea sp.]